MMACHLSWLTGKLEIQWLRVTEKRGRGRGICWVDGCRCAAANQGLFPGGERRYVLMWVQHFLLLCEVFVFWVCGALWVCSEFLFCFPLFLLFSFSLLFVYVCVVTSVFENDTSWSFVGDKCVCTSLVSDGTVILSVSRKPVCSCLSHRSCSRSVTLWVVSLVRLTAPNTVIKLDSFLRLLHQKCQ